jgi:hypothetical protein
MPEGGGGGADSHGWTGISMVVILPPRAANPVPLDDQPKLPRHITDTDVVPDPCTILVQHVRQLAGRNQLPHTREIGRQHAVLVHGWAPNEQPRPPSDRGRWS